MQGGGGNFRPKKMVSDIKVIFSNFALFQGVNVESR